MVETGYAENPSHFFLLLWDGIETQSVFLILVLRIIFMIQKKKKKHHTTGKQTPNLWLLFLRTKLKMEGESRCVQGRMPSYAI
jgi:hypothetical protein